MKTFLNFLRDEKAAEVTELAVVLALIVAGAVGIIAQVGPPIQQAWQDMADAMINSAP